jgi:hypothetical protein
LFAVDFLDDATGFIAGASGTILKTTNGGTSWTRSTTATTRDLFVVTGATANTVWAIGDSGLILCSTDRGVTWFPEFSNTGYDLFGLYVVSDSLAWICGDNGTILSNRSAPIMSSVEKRNTEHERSISGEFSLLRNFPNPFSSRTAVSYQLSTYSFVDLRVYDVLGREVAVLVNAQQPPGMYRATWDAGELPSGIFFYRLSVGSVTKIARMNLVK